MVRQSEAEAPSKSKVEDMEDGAAARSSLSYLLTLYRAAAVCQLMRIVPSAKRHLSLAQLPQHHVPAQLSNTGAERLCFCLSFSWLEHRRVCPRRWA